MTVSEYKGKTASRTFLGFHLDPAFMHVHDLAAKAEAYTGAFFPGGEKGYEDLVQDILIDPCPVIPDPY